MKSVIDWLNDNAGLLNLVFAFVVAGSAIFTAVFNRRLTGETVALRKAVTDPMARSARR